ncbi:hypothetical protein [Flavobacterium capsici]|uniref:Uncharacterized protein n=1 Tax=Flavobacterium capsici TaxID=3075618 RepID=A0AA96J5R6_9FLAO|nr:MULTISPECIES: hypothetical protein [unclassified Flavobacterium]WNM19291.1 hypothetical protein RN608_01080 [Flavobacterium sp. PMR2A8]WNM20680.1 hypothetical protein RN605_08250 [Flavobacterium sp. PMTSA4]
MAEKRVAKKTGLTSCGTRLKPGYKYKKGGAIVKVTPKKKAAAKKKAVSKKRK